MTQSLLAKVGGGVDYDCLAGMFDEHGNAQPLVTLIIGAARLAIAGD